MSGLSTINFVFFREGTSDEGILPHLRDLLVRAGAPEAQGTVRPERPPVTRQLAAVAAEADRPNMIFVHRDADREGPTARRTEIAVAAAENSVLEPVVPVIPVRHLEAWLLLSEGEIRRAVGRPRGSVPLSLPSLREIEEKDCKTILRRALVEAGETSGRRRQKASTDAAFSAYRKVLLERLDIDGPVRELPSWRALEADIRTAVSRLMSA